MAQKTVAVMVILLFLGAGVFIGSLAGGFVGQLTVPATHRAIVDKMTIKVGSYELSPSYLSTGKSTWQSFSTLQENFLQDGTYQYTLWVYSYQGDPEVYVCIWGPGEDGETYQVELCAAWTRYYTVTCKGVDHSFQGQTNFAVVVT